MLSFSIWSKRPRTPTRGTLLNVEIPMRGKPFPNLALLGRLRRVNLSESINPKVIFIMDGVLTALDMSSSNMPKAPCLSCRGKNYLLQSQPRLIFVNRESPEVYVLASDYF